MRKLMIPRYYSGCNNCGFLKVATIACLVALGACAAMDKAATTTNQFASQIATQCQALMPLAVAATPLPVVGPYVATGVQVGCTADGIVRLATDPTSVQWLDQQGVLLRNGLAAAGVKV